MGCRVDGEKRSIGKRKSTPGCAVGEKPMGGGCVFLENVNTPTHDARTLGLAHVTILKKEKEG